MSLNKQAVPINFSQGVDTKADPKQVQMGKFIALQNSVFTKTGALTKRNGFGQITKLPNALQTTLTTLNGNLLATGSNLYAFSQETNQWLNQGSIQSVSLKTQSIIRNSASQTGIDTAVSATGLACTVYIQNGLPYYVVSDVATGQQIVPSVLLENTASSPKVFVLGAYFVITFLSTFSGSPHVRYLAIPTATPASPLAAADVSTDLQSITSGYDAVVANDTLYISWAASANAIKINYISRTLLLSAAKTILAHTASLVSLTADISGPSSVVWVSFWDGTSSTAGNMYVAAYNQTLGVVNPANQIVTGVSLSQITSAATLGVLSIIYETKNTYSYAPNAQTDYVSFLTVAQAGLALSTPVVILRSVGLASKAFYDNGIAYVLVTYGESNQPTYFLIDLKGTVYLRLAYANGGGYQSTQVLPNVSLFNGVHYVPYAIKDFLATVNKTTNSPPGTPVNAIYTQTGINLAEFALNASGQYSAEIGDTLHLTGGKLWMYDGVKPVEHGFNVWPENLAVTTSVTGGALTAQTYFYRFCYEWTDNQGNLHRSAPSIPLSQITTGTASSNTIYVPTLRITSKVSPNPVRIVGYRWSVAQQVYYQFTSITTPVLNDTTIDFVTIIDTLADSAILGQTLLYTTGGVIENIAAPASTVSCLFKSRLFLVDAEDQNLLWYSKQVIQATPVEMSDLFTIYVAPTSGAQGSTGAITALSAMDDKLIVFKKDAIYYITGNGPDNTGGNNDFSDPVFITSSVGCTNPKSIVLMPMGIMFQSDKGIWLLGRDLQTQYIGAPVESYNNQLVESAQVIPGTNQIRFLLANSNITLMYDYYFSQWGTFTNLSAVSSTLYQGAHTYLNSAGTVYQEQPNTYIDGSAPVLLSFTTSWISLAGLQGYERFYFMYLLGAYFTPFKLSVQIAYDYNTSSSQYVTVTPDNYSPPYGNDPSWGASAVWGGPSNVFETRIFPSKQKCETFQITITELYDSSLGVQAGQGLSLSGMNIVVGAKKGYRVQKAGQSFG